VIEAIAASHTTRAATVERIPDPAGAELEAIWDREWQMKLRDAALVKAKAQCDLKPWQIFDLYVLKEWLVREVTKALGVSAGRVYLTKHRISALVPPARRFIGRRSLARF
jgi:hypothetical protein